MIKNYLLVFFARFLIYLLFLSLPYFWFKKNKGLFLKILISVSFAFFASEVIKYFFPVERPFVVQDLEPRIPQLKDPSFPSQHAAIVSAFAVSAFFENKTLGVLFVISALAIGIARVLALVHYPLDIIAGYFLGGTVAYVVHRLHVYF